MSRSFRPQASYTSLAELFDESPKAGPNIFSAYKVNSFGLSEMSGKDMIMLVLKDTEPEIIGVRNPDTIIKSEKTLFHQSMYPHHNVPWSTLLGHYNVLGYTGARGIVMPVCRKYQRVRIGIGRVGIGISGTLGDMGITRCP